MTRLSNLSVTDMHCACQSWFQLRWDQIYFLNKTLHVNRVKRSTSSLHPLQNDVIHAFHVIQIANREGPDVFLSHRGEQLSICTVRKIIARAGVKAELPFSIHPHMLRHACGFYLDNKVFLHPRNTELQGSQEYPAHCQIHRTHSQALSGFLDRPMFAYDFTSPQLLRLLYRRRST